MAENNFKGTVEALFHGMDGVISSKTVVGEAIQIKDTIILPLVDVSCGMAAGAFADKGKNKDNGAGGMSAKISPSAVLVIQNGVTKLVSVKNQDPLTKALDMVPDVVNRFVGGPKGAGEVSPRAMEAAEEIAGKQ